MMGELRLKEQQATIYTIANHHPDLQPNQLLVKVGYTQTDITKQNNRVDIVKRKVEKQNPEKYTPEILFTHKVNPRATKKEGLKEERETRAKTGMPLHKDAALRMGVPNDGKTEWAITTEKRIKEINKKGIQNVRAFSGQDVLLPDYLDKRTLRSVTKVHLNTVASKTGSNDKQKSVSQTKTQNSTAAKISPSNKSSSAKGSKTVQPKASTGQRVPITNTGSASKNGAKTSQAARPIQAPKSAKSQTSRSQTSSTKSTTVGRPASRPVGRPKKK